ARIDRSLASRLRCAAHEAAGARRANSFRAPPPPNILTRFFARARPVARRPGARGGGSAPRHLVPRSAAAKYPHAILCAGRASRRDARRKLCESALRISSEGDARYLAARSEEH